MVDVKIKNQPTIWNIVTLTLNCGTLLSSTIISNYWIAINVQNTNK